jgi:hypothetical protein
LLLLELAKQIQYKEMPLSPCRNNGGGKNHTHQNLWTKDTKGGGDCRDLIERKNEWHLLLQKEKLERKNKPPMHRGHSNTKIHTK